MFFEPGGMGDCLFPLARERERFGNAPNRTTARLFPLFPLFPLRRPLFS